MASVQFNSVAQSCQTLCDSMDCSTTGFPVHHQLLELAQTHVHRVGDAVQPSHLLLSPSPPAFNFSQHQGLFQGVSSLHQVAKILEFHLLASVLPMNIQDGFPLGWTGWISSLSKELSRVFSNTTVQKNQFFSAQLASQSSSNIHSVVQFSSVTQSSPTLCDPMNRSTPGLPVHHQLPEFTQTRVH